MRERRMMGNYHVRCGAGEKLEMISKTYLWLSIINDITYLFFNNSDELYIDNLNNKITFKSLEKHIKSH